MHFKTKITKMNICTGDSILLAIVTTSGRHLLQYHFVYKARLATFSSQLSSLPGTVMSHYHVLLCLGYSGLQVQVMGPGH